MVVAFRGFGVLDEPTVDLRQEDLRATASDLPSGGHTGRVHLSDLAAELYQLPPEDFVAARDQRVRALRRAGARELAEEVRRLRRPALSAWLVNLLAGRERAALEDLLEVGARMRAASTAADPGLRALTDDRRRRVTALTRSAGQLAGRRLAAGALAEVTATLEAATVDPAVADAVRSGRSVQPLAYAGFGPLPEAAAAVGGGAPPTKSGPTKSGPTKSGPTKSGPRTVAPERARASREARELAGAADDAQRAYEAVATQAKQAATDVAQAEAVVREARDALAEAQSRRRAADRALRDAEVQARRAHAEAGAARERLAELDRAPGAPVSPR